jgi:hypothetical protein
MNAKWITGLVLAAATATLSPSQTQAAGTTQITIGNPSYNGPPITQATVPITMELDSNQTSFTSVSVNVTYGLIAPWHQAPYSFGPYSAPQPGKGPQTVQIFVTVQKGTTYTVNATMYYVDGNNMPASMKATPMQFTP